MTRPTPIYPALKDKQRRLRDGFDVALGLRVHRAISWIRGAERAAEDGDDDAAFIAYWIAFNAAYVQPWHLHEQSQAQEFRLYFERIVRLDRTGVIRKAVRGRIEHTRRLLQNPFVYRLFWQWRYGVVGYENWQDSFVRESRTVELALNRQDAVVVLKTLFDRLYVLRNQLIHGGATWGGSLNREQVRDGAVIMAALVPHFVDVMMDHPNEDWGESPYPVDADRSG